MSHLNWSVKKFENLSPLELYGILQLREAVFVLEQTCLYQDLDDRDQVSLHIQGRDPQNNRLAAYARVIPPGVTFDEPCISRVVTSHPYRGRALGKALMQRAIEVVEEHYPSRTIRISAQAHLQKFYREFGFAAEGSIYDEDGIDHIAMIRMPPTRNFLDIHTHRSTPAATDGTGICIYNLPAEEFKNAPSQWDGATPSGQFFSVGIHPWDVDVENLEAQLQQVDQLASHPQVALLGECGLDKLRGPSLPLQERAFTAQLKLANRHHKPVIIHCVKAFDELIRIRKETRPSVPMIIHGYRSSPELARQLTRQGFLLSFGTALWNPQSQGATTIQQLLDEEIPFFLETDDSDIPIEEIYARTAYLLKIRVDQLKDLIFASWKEIGLKNG